MISPPASQAHVRAVDQGVRGRWVYETPFQHIFPHERSDRSNWRKCLGDKLDLLLAESRWVASHSAPGTWPGSLPTMMQLKNSIFRPEPTSPKLSGEAGPTRSHIRSKPGTPKKFRMRTL